jgi:DNA-directed RNA polymerase subunit A'
MKPIKKQVNGLYFSLLNPESIKKIAMARVVTPELYDIDGYPVDGGLMDLRLGAIDPGVRCRTCGGRLKECLGHPGMIELSRPVLHIKYIQIVEMCLKSFCQHCGKFLLEDEKAKEYSLKERIKKAKDAKKCSHCLQLQEKIKLEKPLTFKKGKKRIFPDELREILVAIGDEDLKQIGINPEFFRPEWAILTVLLVPPVTVRPSITLETGERSEDDLTHKLGDIIRADQRLRENLNAGAPEVIIDDLWDLLQYHITTFYDNNISGVPPARHRSGHPLKTITERIKGKEGRIRHNLAGKRVNFSSRTVISPDPNLKINEIGVPKEIAMTLTVNESVTTLNIEYLKNLIRSWEYPGANYIIRPDGKRKKITKDLKEEIIEELSPGYVVERHLRDGDIVLFNRHPSLHKSSLMAHRVKILPYRTFRLHPSVCFPYNADFDGDEMNIHVAQTEEARAEAEILLDVTQNLMSPKNNTNMIGCIADATTGNYLLNLNELDSAEANQIVYEAGVEHGFSKKNLSGKEIVSEILPKIDFSYKPKSAEEILSIKKGEVVSGVIDDKVVGVESGVLVREFDAKIGREKTLEAIRKIFSLGTKYLSKHGFTISIKDLKVNKKVSDITEKTIKEAESKTKEIIDSYHEETLEIIPGKTIEETREIKIIQVLNEVRTKIGQIVKQEFPKDNPLNSMILSGSGGNILNITQMACCVGQQSLWGKRIGIGYTNRTLSFFKEHDLSPVAKGFIESPFMKGLKPFEFFFGAITGRDSLMDTALRTPKSGYLYRRLANSLQDMKVAYDGTVRDGSENIIQFLYGGDGLDVSGLHKEKKIAPGEAIGIVTAQSIGEPSTQMVLNVFHAAGVAEMQVTQGLPRLIEIVDARKTPSTPTMEIYLDRQHNNEKDARVVAEKIKEARFGDVIDKIKVNFGEKKIEALLSNESIRLIHSTIGTLSEKLKEEGYANRIKENSIVFSEPKADFKQLYRMKEKIKTIHVSGIKGISEVLVVKRDDDYVILTSGTNLEEVISMKGVDSSRTKTNDLHEIKEVLGIEAARQAIINEITKTIEGQGIDIDKRHLKLVADAMTFSGSVQGSTRMGIISQKSSVLARASFETPIKHFVNATLKMTKDELASVIENIILNQPIPVGTGLPGLLVKVTGRLVPKEMDEARKKAEEKTRKKKEEKKKDEEK